MYITVKKVKNKICFAFSKKQKFTAYFYSFFLHIIQKIHNSIAQAVYNISHFRSLFAYICLPLLNNQKLQKVGTSMAYLLDTEKDLHRYKQENEGHLETKLPIASEQKPEDVNGMMAQYHSGIVFRVKKLGMND